MLKSVSLVHWYNKQERDKMATVRGRSRYAFVAFSWLLAVVNIAGAQNFDGWDGKCLMLLNINEMQ